MTSTPIAREPRTSILFIGPLPEPTTGQSLACQVLHDELAKHYSVDVINLTKREFKQGVSSLSRVGGVLRILRDVWRRRGQPGLIYFTISESLAGNAKDLLIYAICFRHLSRMIIHLHGGAGIRRFMLDRQGVIRRVNEFFVRRLGGAIVLGERQHDVFRNALPETKIHIVPNFAEDYLFIDENRIEGKFGETSPLRLLFLSNLLPGKGHLELVEAFFAMDRSTRETIEIDFAGGFESEDQKATFLKTIEKARQLRYHGVVSGDRKRSLFHRAHVFCLPTYYPYEGQPISILEAYASGCAVITTDHSGIGDVFADDVNGYVVTARAADDLRRAIGLALANVPRLREMAVANRRKADAEFRTSTYNHNLLRVIQSVTNSRAQTTGHR